MINTKMIRPGYDSKEALVLLLHTDPSLDLQDIDEVYYPYMRLRHRIQVGKKRFARQLNKFSDCIVDRVSGSTYETKGEPDFIDVEIPEDIALEINIPENECYDIAHSFVLKQYLGKAKLMFVPDIEIIEEDAFYKKFYIVTCLDDDGNLYYILVDAVDGGLSVLDHEKHVQEMAKQGDLEGAERFLDYLDAEEEELAEKKDEEDN